MASETLVTKVQNRRAELEAALETLDPADHRSKLDIENALRAVARLLTGDLEHIPEITFKELVKWLESSKYLGRRAAE